ncbi:tRNA (adenine-N1)-methyltransferase [Desulfohalovibrio reitneri]|uniref:tRNA (adenine-N1)-methyltransferase n=1 Tax=Desulfohalovibrio reitneri TaxID=1307759 RepID=UPI00068AE85B|nr:tRNA (adenine-N1)-methyltransferase [Desulfohalovibrio reitneri]
MIETGELVLLVSPKGKRYLRRLDPSQPLHTNDGRLSMEDVAGAGFGGVARTHMGRPYRIHHPTLYDLCKHVKRQTQIIYPKEIGYILMRLSIGPGKTVIEAGSGSGSLTMALAWSVGPTGKVYTFERREEFSKLAARNLAWAGLDDGRAETRVADISEGFDCPLADALFLDVRTPWDYLEQAAAAVKPGAPFGFLLPTTNQVSRLLEGLEQGPFADVECLEILLRRYKPVPDRFRPEDRMVAHTGFLVFARHAPAAEAKVEAAESEPAAEAEASAEPDVEAPETPGAAHEEIGGQPDRSE